MAVAKVSVTTLPAATTPGVATLDASDSFDADPGGSIASYRWEVITEAYQWLAVSHSSDQSPTATFTIPTEALAARYGRSIEFRLTVTDSGQPAASATATVVFLISQVTDIEVVVSAKLADPEAAKVEDEIEKVYTIEAVIDGPGENGNADNEWDIQEGARLVLEGSARSDSNGRIPASGFSWERIHISPDSGTATSATLPDSTAGAKQLVAHPSVGLLESGNGHEAKPFYVYYRLTATSGSYSRSAVVKIVIHDQPVGPEIALDDIDDVDGEGVQATARDSQYLVLPGTVVTLIARASDSDGDIPRIFWHGAEPTDTDAVPGVSSAVFIAPNGALDGTEFNVTATAVDVTGRTSHASYRLVVAENHRPGAVAPSDFTTSDGADGGDLVPDETGEPDDSELVPTGVQTLRGFGFDPDGGELRFSWAEWALPIDGDGHLMEPGQGVNGPLTYDHDNDSATAEIAIAPFPIPTNREPVLAIDGATRETASFAVPEVDSSQHVTNAAGDLVVPIAFTVTDQWGVVATDIVLVTIADDDDVPVADPDPDRQVSSGAFVRLRADNSTDADPGEVLAYQWRYAGIAATHPKTQHRAPMDANEQAQGFVEGQWFPDPDSGTYHPTAGGRLMGAATAFPYFDAPVLTGFHSVALSFELVVADQGGQASEPAYVTVTVVSEFFSGTITGPDFCTELSLGGPVTYAFDSNGDGVADICSLSTTRRAAVARQNALELLASLNSDTFDAASAPPPIDPTKAGEFFSGAISGPEYCANLSLGGPTTFPFDSDEDGVADVCSLPYTRKEAVARQEALEQLEGDPQYPEALAAACLALGSLDFGDDPRDLANDLCVPQANGPKGVPLPTLAR